MKNAVIASIIDDVIILIRKIFIVFTIYMTPFLNYIDIINIFAGDIQTCIFFGKYERIFITRKGEFYGNNFYKNVNNICVCIDSA